MGEPQFTPGGVVSHSTNIPLHFQIIPVWMVSYIYSPSSFEDWVKLDFVEMENSVGKDSTMNKNTSDGKALVYLGKTCSESL